MKKIALLLAILCTPLLYANEGMWFLMHIERLNQRDMEKLGLQLTAEEIYSINNNSLKDAIVQFGGGCTAEIISETGLVLTNHHCGYGNIAQVSTPENDYLNDGFWAKNLEEEIKPENLSVRFFVRMDDVTERILSKLNDSMSEDERQKAIQEESAKIEQENNEGGKYTVSVKSFYSGNEFYYFVYQDYSDVRLVGTPPNSIGKFGGDTDNWEWPRHTGDFSIFRVYADKEGNPAAYSEENVPLKPKHYLNVSLNGHEEGDFTMILGYPGRTNRWMPSAGIEQNVEYAYPAWVEGSKVGMDVLKHFMDQNKEVQLDYASKYAGIANYWKNRQGMIDALKEHRTAETKVEAEKKFIEWANKKKNRATYAQVMPTIYKYYQATNEKSAHNNYLMGGLLRASSIAPLPYSLGNSFLHYINETDNAKAQLLSRLEQQIDARYGKLHSEVEEAVLAAQLNLYYAKAGDAYLAPYIKELGYELNGDFTEYVAEAFKTSIFRSGEAAKEFLKEPTTEALENDKLYQLSKSILDHYRAQSDEDKALANEFQTAYRLMIKGMREANPKQKYYPDANSTLRLTYGTVRALPESPLNTDVKINNYTTLDATVAKYIPGDEEFDMPLKQIELNKAKDYGQYANKDGELVVNFLTDHDITGGNSGSPVLNANGELIGIAFDGNIEAMAGDVIFDPKLQRAINVDIRYVLWVVDKIYGATNIIDELTLIKD